MTRNPNATRLVRRLAVEGASMVPTLLPGDRVVAVRMPVGAGDLVALRDPREPSRIVVKRVVARDHEGRLVVHGDNPGASTDSRTFGAVDPSLVVGRVVYRYAPPHRAGRLVRRRSV